MFEYDQYGNIINGYDYHGANIPLRDAANDPFPIRRDPREPMQAVQYNPTPPPPPQEQRLPGRMPAEYLRVGDGINTSGGGFLDKLKLPFQKAGSALGKIGGLVGKFAGPLAIAGGAIGIMSSLFGGGRARNEQRKAKEQYDKMMAQYRSLDTSNIYADVENKFTNLENAYEDMTINQQQAQFEAQQGAQQRANIMQNFKGAAGASGIAGLAQAMASQGQIAAQKASASIGLQESRIQQLQASESSRLQRMERVGEAQAEAMRLSGAETARNLEYQKAGTQLGMAQQRLAAANRAAAAKQSNIIGGIAGVAGAVLPGVISNYLNKPDVEESTDSEGSGEGSGESSSE